MKILIFGYKGYLGSEFIRQLNEMDGVEVSNIPSRNSDGTGFTFIQLDFIVSCISPDVIINASAYVGGKSGIAECESHKAETINSNLIFPKMLGEVCQKRNIVLGHISSGCLYNGYVTDGFKETDSPNMTFEENNCSFYTGTKVMAEQALVSVEKKYIWRVRLPFNNRNHSRNYISKLMNFDELISFKNSLSHKEDFVTACIDCLFRKVPYGIYNMTNPGALSAKEIVDLLTIHLKVTKTYKFVETLTGQLDIPRSNTILNTDKLQQTGIIIRPVQEAMIDSLKNWHWI